MAGVTISSPTMGSTINATFTANGTREIKGDPVSGIMRPTSTSGADKAGTPLAGDGAQWAMQFSGLTAGVTYKLIASVQGGMAEVTGLLVQGP